jgi:hypothetical protein
MKIKEAKKLVTEEEKLRIKESKPSARQKIRKMMTGEVEPKNKEPDDEDKEPSDEEELLPQEDEIDDALNN